MESGPELVCGEKLTLCLSPSIAQQGSRNPHFPMYLRAHLCLPDPPQPSL